MLRKRKVRMVFISSAAAEKPNLGQGFYAASKLAVEALYRNLGLEMGNRGITTVSLRFGFIDSGRGRRYLRNRKAPLLGNEPEWRVLDVKDATELILFFLSNQAEKFNAMEISINESLKKRILG